MKTLVEMESALEDCELIIAFAKRLRERIEFEIKSGAKSQNFKIIQKKSNRKLKSGAEEFLLTLDIDEKSFYKRALVGIPALEKMLEGEDLKRFRTYVERPKGGEKLVSISEKGEALQFENVQFEKLD